VPSTALHSQAVIADENARRLQSTIGGSSRFPTEPRGGGKVILNAMGAIEGLF